MNTESGLDGKWQGSHLTSCQRRKCKNPKRNLINCFSCQRAFCNPCWKKVSKMPPVMKAAKGFQNCSIEPRPQNSQRLDPHLDRIHQEESFHSSIQVAKMVNSLRDPPTKQILCFDLSDSDDSEIEIQERPWASEFSVPEEVESQIQPTSKLQHTDLFPQSGKRRIEDGGEDVENHTAKRSKSTFPMSSILTSNAESLERTSPSHSQSSALIDSYDGLNGGSIGKTYISEGHYHTLLEDLDREEAYSGRQEHETLAIARQALLSMGDDAVLGHTPKIGCGPGTHHTRRICETTAPTENAGDSSMLESGSIEKIGHVQSRISQEENDTVQERYQLTSKERSPETSHTRLSPGTNGRSPSDATCKNIGRPPVTILQGDLLPEQGEAEKLRTPMPHSTQLRSPSAQSSSHHALTNSLSDSTGSSQQVGCSYQPQVVGVAPSAECQHRHLISTISGCLHQPSSSPDGMQGAQNASDCPPSAIEQFEPGFPVQEMPNSGMFGPRNSLAGLVSGAIGEQQRLDKQTAQSQLPTYHQHKIPSVQSQSSQDPLPQHSPAILQAGSIPRFPGPNNYTAPTHPPHGASHSGGLPRPSKMAASAQAALRSDIPTSGHDRSPLAEFEYASTEIEVENLPAEQKELGDGWLTLFNPQVQRTLEINLLHTFSLESTVCCVRFSPDGRYLATGCKNSAQIFDTVTGTSEYVLLIQHIGDTKKDVHVSSVCFSPDGRLLAIASEDRLIRVWDIESRSARNIWAEHEEDILSLDFSRDGRLIASGGGQLDNSTMHGTVRLWDVEKGLEMMSLKTEKCVTSVAFSPDTIYVAAGSLDNGARVWNISTGFVAEDFDGHTGSISSVAFSPDSKSLLTGSLDKTVKMWPLTASRSNLTLEPIRERPVRTFESHKDFVLSVAATPDGAWILSGSKDRGVHFWNPYTGVSHLRLQSHQDSVLCMATSPLLSPEKGGLFATGSYDTQAKIWSYNIVVPQQPSQNGIPDSPQYIPYIPNAAPGPQKFQHNERQATAGSLFSSFRLQKAHVSISQTQKQVGSTNVTSKPQYALSQYGLAPENTNVNKKAGSFDHIQSLSQLPSPPDNSAWRSTQPAELNSVLRVESPPGQLESNNQHIGKETGTSSISSAPNGDNKSWLRLLKQTQQFALQGSRRLPQQLQKVYGAQGSLPRNEEAIQAHQIKLDRMKNDIIATEAHYDGILQCISEQEKFDLVFLRERTVASMRARFEDGEEKLRVIRQDKAEVELWTQLVRDLKTILPDLVKALQRLEKYVGTLPDV